MRDRAVIATAGWKAIATGLASILIAFGSMGLAAPRASAADVLLIKDGKPRAEIVISDKPERLVKLAATELQVYLEKISGGRLPIVTSPTPGCPAQVYVGRSEHTDRLEVSAEGLSRGAFRMVSGPTWLVLLGHDEDFQPTEPWARSPNPAERARAAAEWDKLTGETWSDPIGSSLYRHYSRTMDLWDYDEGGSLNAVYAFLRRLGVEWYMPGELGEIVPKQATIELPDVDVKVVLDFAVRHYMMSPFGSAHRDDLLWYLRLGLTRNDRELHPHGMRELVGRPEVKKAHPEYFALYGGKRDTGEGLTGNCFSSEGLFREHVRFVRFLFDHYPDERVIVSIMPEDGLGAVCGCPLCDGKGDPERGSKGHMSDYVWDYVNRVAKEVLKSHPKRRVSCFAYAGYLEPPEKIETLSPNLILVFDQARHAFGDPAARKQYVEARERWRKKLAPGAKMLLGIHLPYTEPGRPHNGMPVYLPHRIAEDLRSLKGISDGEFVSQGFERHDKQHLGALDSPGFSHLNVYVSSRFYWDADQDVDALLDDYYARFYGPAGDEMKAFLEYCEQHHPALRKEHERIETVFSLLAKAQAKAPADSVYARRIALVADFLKPLKGLAAQLAKGRENVPEARGYIMPSQYIPDATITIDGRLDEDAWKKSGEYPLRDLITGEKPTQGTTFEMLWSGDSFYIGIYCNEKDMAHLNNTATRPDDPAIWEGDCIEILLETQNHSYYQLAVSPKGALMDLDRVSGLETRWSSKAEVATHRGENGWSVEIRLPIADETHTDPLHQVVGRRPNTTYPWYLNVCRARIRDEESEFSAFSPTGRKSFHDVSKFGRIHVR